MATVAFFLRKTGKINTKRPRGPHWRSGDEEEEEEEADIDKRCADRHGDGVWWEFGMRDALRVGFHDHQVQPVIGSVRGGGKQTNPVEDGSCALRSEATVSP